MSEVNYGVKTDLTICMFPLSLRRTVQHLNNISAIHHNKKLTRKIRRQGLKWRNSLAPCHHFNLLPRCISHLPLQSCRLHLYQLPLRRLWFLYQSDLFHW